MTSVWSRRAGLAGCGLSSRKEQPPCGPPPTAWNQRLVEPVSAPVSFESPIIQTDVNPFFAYHTFPNGSIFGGGNLQLYAVQLRLALTERLAFIATKHVPDEEGWADLGLTAGAEEAARGR